MYGRVSPEATVETISFGTPTGSAAHRDAGDRRVARAADRRDPVQPPLGVQPPDDLGRAPGHRLDGHAAVAGLGERVRRRRRPRRPPPRRDTSGSTCGSKTPTSTSRHVDALLAQPLGEVRVLVALRVERAEQDDGRPSVTRFPACRPAQGSRPGLESLSFAFVQRRLATRTVD